MSDLRARIAAVLDQHKTDLYDEWTCQCNSTGIRWADHVADAVIRELKLTPETSYGTTYPNVPIRDVTYVRYVTEWREDD